MKKLIARIILISDSTPTIWERLKYAGLSIVHFAPVAFVLDLINLWFADNQQFGTFMCVALVMNMIAGVWLHLKKGTFHFRSFLLGTLEMVAVVIVVYIMLEMLRYTAGDNFAGEIFRVLIQITTLLYPTSKVLKNIHIITKGKYPPRFIMHRLYNFEKNGDLNEFFNRYDKGPDDDRRTGA